MKQRLSLVIGIFIIMALSNAIVPVLPEFASEMPALQGFIFSAYFFGAFIAVIPAGVLGDRYGRVPFIRAGLVLTVLSGALILMGVNPYVVAAARAIEGIGAGLFVACALSWVNVQPDHARLSGYYFAALNAGLIAGFMGTGVLTSRFGLYSGVILYSVLAIFPMVLSFFIREAKSPVSEKLPEIHRIGWRNIWLYFSAFVLIGISGVLISLYPEFTDESPFVLGVLFATMNAATICSSLIAPNLTLQPIQTIRIASALVGIAVLSSFFLPLYGGIVPVFVLFVVIGGSIGFVFVSQMNYLAVTEEMQGTAIGLLTAASYGGMAFLPFFAGVVSEYLSYSAAFVVNGIFCLVVTATITRCRCTLPV